MNGLWVIIALAIAWVVLRVALRPLVALVFGKEIGRRALARVPETVHLTRRGEDAWKDPDQLRRRWEPLLAHGFADAGAFGVDEMPGVMIRLLASPSDSIIAIAYEHPSAGQWLELSTYYTDGRRCSASNHPAPGVDTPPFVTMLRVVGAPALKLLEVMRHKRPDGAMVPVAPADVARMFEQDYAESMAWRRQNPLSTREVVKVSMKRAA